MVKITETPINKGCFGEIETSNIALACYPLAYPSPRQVGTEVISTLIVLINLYKSIMLKNR